MNKDAEIEKFNWAKVFPQVCDENGNFEGFNVVIGNPPYTYFRDIPKNEREYYKNKYKTADDLYAYFLYGGLNIC
ncbi:MAG: Eco57I restriction-modification methylase domain-containing protein [Bacteroidota bacterium]|nr:Eco57I restriction-modification methylase domain-containing protein [Bacteroidota bacterium]